MSTNQSEVSKSLLQAVRKGQSEKVTEIISQYGLSFFPEFSEGYVLLCDAIRYRCVAVTKLLLEKGAKMKGESDSSPLHLAVEEGVLKVVECLLKFGTEIECLWLRDGYTPLHIACGKNCNDIISLLLMNGADPNAKANDGTTPLHLTAQEGNVEVFELLLQHGAQANCSRLPDKFTPLHIACEGCWVKIVDRLLKSGASPNAVANDNSTPLHLAAGQNQEEIMKLLLESGADVNHSRLTDNYTPLHVACGGDSDPYIVEYLLNNGADPNVKANDHLTPLHLAVGYFGSLPVVKSLLNHGADVDCSVLSNNYTPLLIACATKHPYYPHRHNKVVDVLLNHGANPNVRANDNISPLHLAVMNSSVKTVESLLNHGAKINCSRYRDLYTPLHIACENKEKDINLGAKINCSMYRDIHTSLLVARENKEKDIVDVLLDRGADQTIKSCYGMTPLHLAVQAVNMKIVESLLSHKPYEDIQTGRVPEECVFPSDSTPLHIACLNSKGNSHELVDALLKNGADPNIEACDGTAPLHVAVMFDIKQQQQIIESLVKHGAYINCARTSDYYTPLHITCAESGELVDVLLRCGADPNVRGKDNVTPLHLAAKKMNVRAVVLLLNESADLNLETQQGLFPLDLALKKSTGENSGNESSEEIQIVAAFTAHAVKLKVAGLHVNEKYLHLLKKEEFMPHNFEENCEEEVKQMKRTQITNDFTVFDVLKNRQYPGYARNESLMKSLKQFLVQSLMSLCFENFSYYGTLLITCLKKSTKRLELLDTGEKSLGDLLEIKNIKDINGASIPNELLREIVSYLNDGELRNLNVCAENLNRQFKK